MGVLLAPGPWLAQWAVNPVPSLLGLWLCLPRNGASLMETHLNSPPCHLPSAYYRGVAETQGFWVRAGKDSSTSSHGVGALRKFRAVVCFSWLRAKGRERFILERGWYRGLSIGNPERKHTGRLFAHHFCRKQGPHWVEILRFIIPLQTHPPASTEWS